MDLWTIVSGVALLVGLATGLLQLLDYVQKSREKKKEVAREASQSAPAPPPPTSQPQPPAPPALKITPNNLPEEATSLVGREKEIAAVCDLLKGEHTRLVTLTGPGGMGKTRLAQRVAREALPDFPDGVYFVALAPLSDRDLFITTLAGTLGVKEAGGRPLIDVLKEYLRPRHMLLVLDNFEQLLDAAPLVSQLLASAPHVQLLVTSRALLRVQSEYEFPVSPLDVPDPRRLPRPEALAKYKSVALFVSRAQAVKPYFALTPENGLAVAEIVARLDGLPLAIELAAARIKLLTPQELLERLGSRLQLLTGGARDLPARQQTLRSTIDWSYDLLTGDEKTLFTRLSAFVGGCTIAAAEAVVCAPGETLPTPVLDGLESLADKSLLRQETGRDGEVRFSMLQTIREYALERLPLTGVGKEVRDRHVAYFMQLATDGEPKLRGPEQRAWLERLETEHDNLRAALDWAQGQGQGGDAQIALKLAGSLAAFWQIRGYLTEGRDSLTATLTAPGAQEPTAPRAKALLVAARLAFAQGDQATAGQLFEQALDVWRALGNKHGMASSLLGLGHVASERGDYDAARKLYTESLEIWRELGEKVSIASTLNNLGIVARRQGDYAGARDLLNGSLQQLRELGDKLGSAGALSNLGDVALAQSDYAGAKSLFEESLELRRTVGDRGGTSISLDKLGRVALRQGEYGRARELFEESLALREKLGDRAGIAKCLAGLAQLSCEQGDNERGIRLLGAVDGLLANSGSRLDPADRAECERYAAKARDCLDATTYDREWSEGKALTLQQVVEYARRDE